MKKIFYIIAVCFGLLSQGCFIGRPHGGEHRDEGHHNDHGDRH